MLLDTTIEELISSKGILANLIANSSGDSWQFTDCCMD